MDNNYKMENNESSNNMEERLAKCEKMIKKIMEFVDMDTDSYEEEKSEEKPKTKPSIGILLEKDV